MDNTKTQIWRQGVGGPPELPLPALRRSSVPPPPPPRRSAAGSSADGRLSAPAAQPATSGVSGRYLAPGAQPTAAVHASGGRAEQPAASGGVSGRLGTDRRTPVPGVVVGRQALVGMRTLSLGSASGRLPDAPAASLPRPSVAMPATQLLPIERLISPALREIIDPPQPSSPRPAPSKRIRGHLLLAALTITAVAIWKLPPLLARSTPQVRSLARASAPRSAATASSTPVAAADSPAPGMPLTAASTSAGSAPGSRAVAATPPAAATAASAANPASQPASGLPNDRLERAAVDALIAGDYRRAQQLYAELSRVAPAARQFSEAARILAASEPR
jgi:hypothetical protein